MSGYLEVKYPLKSNLGLNPFKSWKRQWCILRPSPTCCGGSLAVYCSEAGVTAGSVDLRADCVVRRAKSRTRPYAFAVFSIDEPRKPRVLLAAQSLQDAQSWMEKIRALLNGDKMLGTETLLKDTYSVTILATELARRCGLSGAGRVLSLTSAGLLVSRPHQLGTFIHWERITDVLLCTECDNNKICVLLVDSEFPRGGGGGELKVATPHAGELSAALRAARPKRRAPRSTSDGDLRAAGLAHIGDVRRSSWYSGPSEVSLDDIDLIMSKECTRLPGGGQLSRCSGEGHLAPPPRAARADLAALDDSMWERRSLASVASGIYEEIPDLPAAEPAADALYCAMGHDAPDGVAEEAPAPEEPTYESVAECVSAAARRPPPPLPPRLPVGTTKLGESWNCRARGEHAAAGAASGVTRHGSLGSLPRCCSVSSGCSARTEPGSARTLPSKSRQAFSVFRKRLKSDSRVGGSRSPKERERADVGKEDKPADTKKKRFELAPATRDIFKSFKVGRKPKGLKGAAGALTKGETKSCEFLDETEHVTANRCSKSVECLEDKEYLDEFDGDLSIEFNDEAVAALALPQEIVNLILRSREQLTRTRLRETQAECDYMPMSPVAPPAPIEHHYIVMSPKTNLA